jgi:hypothetical protein
MQGASSETPTTCPNTALSRCQVAHVRHQRLFLSAFNQLRLVPEPFHGAKHSHKKAQKAHKTSEKFCASCASLWLKESSEEIK